MASSRPASTSSSEPASIEREKGGGEVGERTYGRLEARGTYCNMEEE